MLSITQGRPTRRCTVALSKGVAFSVAIVAIVAFVSETRVGRAMATLEGVPFRLASVANIAIVTVPGHFALPLTPYPSQSPAATATRFLLSI